jgi:hypothetical protein
MTSFEIGGIICFALSTAFALGGLFWRVKSIQIELTEHKSKEEKILNEIFQLLRDIQKSVADLKLEIAKDYIRKEDCEKHHNG